MQSNYAIICTCHTFILKIIPPVLSGKCLKCMHFTSADNDMMDTHVLQMLIFQSIHFRDAAEKCPKKLNFNTPNLYGQNIFSSNSNTLGQIELFSFLPNEMKKTSKNLKSSITDIYKTFIDTDQYKTFGAVITASNWKIHPGKYTLQLAQMMHNHQTHFRLQQYPAAAIIFGCPPKARLLALVAGLSHLEY